MKMARTSAPGNLARVVETKTAAYRNGNTVSSAFHEASEHRRTGDYVGSASRGENAMATSGNHILQSLLQIGCGIKGAMKGDFEGLGQFDECASTLNIDGVVGEKYTENDTGSANTASVLNLLAHGGEGGSIVMKAVGMGAHHHVNGNPAVADGLLDERVRRCEAVHLKRGAKFYAICAAFLRGAACFHCFSAKFKYDQTAQASCPRCIESNATLTPAALSTLTATSKLSRLRRREYHGAPRHFGPCAATSRRHAACPPWQSFGSFSVPRKRANTRTYFGPNIS